jgi:hypothetical protein
MTKTRHFTSSAASAPIAFGGDGMRFVLLLT